MAYKSEGSSHNMEIEQLLKIAGKRLGMDPENLRHIISDKEKAKALLNRVGGEQAEQALKDPQKFQEMLKKNPKADKMFNDLTGGSQHGKQ
ncbi:MAG TPA: hypothetical protein DEP42_04795 [Ruminococcaceae bacterium]|nr:hypothetical protein [Oscillospiraceae bacterium]